MMVVLVSNRSRYRWRSSWRSSGWSVSFQSDGNTVAIGALMNDGNGSDAGHVRYLIENGSSWNQLGQDIDGEAAGDHTGILYPFIVMEIL